MSTEKQPKKTTSMRWYERHREDYNERRRERYRTDKGLREQVLARKRSHVTPAYVGPTMRWVGDEKVQVWTTGAIACKLGCSAQMLRVWQSKQVIPEPTIPGAHRLYLSHQVDIIEQIYKLVVNSHVDKFTEETQLIIQELKEKW